MARNWKPSESAEIAAAWIRVLPVLETLKRGDDIRDDMMESVGKIEARRLAYRIRSFFSERQIKVVRRNGALHLCTPSEQLEASGDHGKRAIGQHRRAFKTARALDPSDLSPIEVKRKDHREQVEAAHLSAARAALKEERMILGAPSPNPRPQLRAAK